MRDHYYLHKMLLCTCVETRGLAVATRKRDWQRQAEKQDGESAHQEDTYLLDDGGLGKLGCIRLRFAIQSLWTGSVIGVCVHGGARRPDRSGSYRFMSDAARASTRGCLLTAREKTRLPITLLFIDRGGGEAAKVPFSGALGPPFSHNNTPIWKT